MCQCQMKIPSWKELRDELKDELIELIECRGLDVKEWSDCGRCVERIIEKGLGIELDLGGGLNKKVQVERLKEYGCIRSWEKVKKNGGRCLSS